MTSCMMVGDALAALAGLADESVQCCITSPPYWGLRDYGVAGQIGLERTPNEYVAHIVAVFREVRRVLRNDGTLWLNLGDSYATGAGKVGDCPGGGKQGANWKGSVTQANRMPLPGLKPKDLVGIPWRVAFALQADGWYLRSDIIWHKPNPMPESVTDRPTKAHEYLFLLAKSQRYFYDAEAIEEPSVTNDPRRPYTSQGAKAMDGRPAAQWHGGEIRFKKEGRNSSGLTRNRRSVWTIATQPFKGAHFATFPEKLVEPCVLAGSRPGDTICDPFAGSGTVGVVARKLGRDFIGIELNPEYGLMAKERIA